MSAPKAASGLQSRLARESRAHLAFFIPCKIMRGTAEMSEAEFLVQLSNQFLFLCVIVAWARRYHIFSVSQGRFLGEGYCTLEFSKLGSDLHQIWNGDDPFNCASNATCL